MKNKISNVLEKYKKAIEQIHHGLVEIYIDENGCVQKVGGRWNEMPDREPPIKSIKFTVLWQINEWLKKKNDLKGCTVNFFIMNWSIKYISIEEKFDNVF